MSELRGGMYAWQQRREPENAVALSPAVERVSRAMPRLLALTAPAGYGKTTLALHYAQSFDNHAVLDLARTKTPRALLFALLKTLRPEHSEDAYLRQLQLSLAADEEVPVDLVERVLDAWHNSYAPSAIVFDNAERLAPEMLPLLDNVLRHCPRHRVCIVCSRAPLELQTFEIASPEETLFIGAADLAFSEEQVRALFADTTISPEQLLDVVEFGQGWPLATLLLHSLCREGRLEAALTRSERAADLERFYEFVQQQVIEMLPADQRRVIEFCAAVPDVRIEDVRICLGSEGTQTLRDAARLLPLIQTSRDRIDVHPLLRASIGTSPHAMEDLRDAARAAVRRGDREAAAERYIASGERNEAINVLDEMLERGANAEVATLAATLDQATLERHPRWFAITALLHRYDVAPAANLANIQKQRARIWETGDDAARFAVGATETHQLIHGGFLEHARERLEELDAIAASLRRGGIVNALRAHVASRFADTLRAAFNVAIGDIEHAEGLLKRNRFTLGQFPMITLCSAVDGWVPLGLLRADIHLIRIQCSRARESLTRSGLDIVLLDLDVIEAFAGWVLGDDVMYEEAVKRVEARALAYRLRCYDHFLSSVGLRAECEPTGIEPLRRLIITHLFAAGRLKDQRGLEHAQHALLLAREMRQPLLITLAAIAVRERGGESELAPGETLSLSPNTERSFLARLRA